MIHMIPEPNFEIGKKYSCKSQCPELDHEKLAHCQLCIRNQYSLEAARDFECPAGNMDVWEEDVT